MMAGKQREEAMRVLFVEDDTKLLNSMRRMSLSHDNIEASFAEGGGKALDILAGQEFDIVVADMRMPGMDGPTLLNMVQERHPEIVRIVLSGHSDRDMIFRVVRLAHQFLSKPCPFKEIMAVLGRVYRLRSVFTDQSIRDVVNRIDMLPVLPDNSQKLLAELENEDCSMPKVGAIISKDPALSADILKVVNSSFFGLSQPVSTPTKAATYLGTDLLHGLVISANLFSTFDPARFPGFSVPLLWTHAMNSALFCRTLCREAPFSLDPDEGFNAGLLHDVGKLILADKFPKKYKKVLDLLAWETMTSAQAEQEVFGTGHAELGAYLLGLWGFPESTVKAVAGHHRPGRFQGEDLPLLTVLHVANVLEHELVVIHNNRVLPGLDQDHLDRAGLNGKRLEHWREVCRTLLKQDNPTEVAQS